MATPPSDLPQPVAEALQRRREFGLLIPLAVLVLLAAQTQLEWILPFDTLALNRLQRWLGAPSLGPTTALLAWTTTGIVLLLAVRLRAHAGATRVADMLVLGAWLGAARVAGGGSESALMVLLATGVASLGWQTLRQTGLALLYANLVSIWAWDAALGASLLFDTLCAAVAAIFVWIDRGLVRAGDLRLAGALTERDGLIGELQALRTARTQLLASISHDLRQPLQAIRLFGDVLAQPDTAAAQVRPLAQRIDRAADDAMDMLEQFSEFSAIEQGTLKLRPEAFELRDLLGRVVANARAAYADEAIDFRIYGHETWLRTDRVHLARIVQNLVGNAARYGLRVAALRRVRVVVAVRCAGSDIAIDVVDNGPGIAASQLESLFQPYVRGDGAAVRDGGRGLGLAIVAGLLQPLGARMAPVRSRPGHGSWFRVLIPGASRVDERAPNIAPPPAGVAAGRASLEGRLLAVLDDDHAARTGLVAALTSAGAHCLSAGAPGELAALLADALRFPDCLVLDLELGAAVDGLGFLSALREELQLQLPAVLLTGNVQVLPTLRLPEACVALAKPASMEQLSAAVATLAARPLVELEGTRAGREERS